MTFNRKRSDMTTKERLTAQLETLTEEDMSALLNMAQRLSCRQVTANWDESRIAALYAEFAEEDRVLAETGMADYATGLAREDAAS